MINILLLTAIVVLFQNWLCKLIISLWQYVIMANYSWILMEGLYLHNLIFLALFSDTSAIRLYVVLGWGLPVLFVGPWVAARTLLEDEFCWTTNNSHLFLLIRLPIVASVLVSFGLFINISRVLLTKLRFAPHLERRRVRYRRASSENRANPLTCIFLHSALRYLPLGLQVAQPSANGGEAVSPPAVHSFVPPAPPAAAVAEGRSWPAKAPPGRLLQMAELGRANGRVRTISASEDERERVRSAQA
ncbi:PDF receptor [Gryllus bimaculatus]|nr:PDF receptor [Gryllus bimaculatus]